MVGPNPKCTHAPAIHQSAHDRRARHPGLVPRRAFFRDTRQPGEPMSENSKDDAQAQFAKVQRANDAKKAMSDYEAAAEAMRAKTARLRALREAREAELAAAAPPAVAKTKSAGKKKGKAPKSTLSEWLESESNAGRRG